MFARKKSENAIPSQSQRCVAGGVRTKKQTQTTTGNQNELPGKPGIPKLKKPAISQQKRAAFGDITNANKEKEDIKKPGVLKIADPKKHLKPVSNLPKTTRAVTKKSDVKKKSVPVKKEAKEVQSRVLENIAAGVPADRQEEDFSFITAEDVSWCEETDKASLFDIDRDNYTDVFNIGIYAQDIFDYYKRRERMFEIPEYLKAKGSKVTPMMRSILVDWMVEIQENFELNHETLYLGVKLIDTYLAREPQDKDMLQLVGAASMFIASKFDERCPPLIEDFTYICDNSFDRDQFIQMEMEILHKVDFDIGIPISYRFLRRYSKIAKTELTTLTLARYILEMSLMESSLVSKKDSMIAAAALYIAMKMCNDGKWEGDVIKSSGYSMDDLKITITFLNNMLHAKPISQLNTIRGKYSHVVFHEVAKIKPLPTSDLL